MPIAFDRIACFALAGFAPLSELESYVEYNAGNASASDWNSPNAGNGWRIDGSTFDVKYNAFPQFISPLPLSRIDINSYNDHAFVSEKGFVTELGTYEH